jgi:hypothetical protein
MRRLRSFIALAGAVVLPGSGFAETYYVSGAGSDSATGLTQATAFRTLQTAANLTKPGDTVMVMSGTYTPAGKGYDVLDITTSGTARAWITYRAMPGQHPVVDFTNGWTGIQVDAAYIVIDGLEVGGGASKVTLAYAKSQAKNLSNYLTSANGIVVDNFINGFLPHHVIIENNIVHDAPGAGIATCYADYITIQHNETYRNAFWSPYANSGISIWEMRDSDTYTGYKNLILDNVSHDNEEFIPFYEAGTITDGNGIIVDDNKNSQSNNVAYGGRTYVANNIVYRNGGSGIHTYSSQHVDIVNNTAWMNNHSPAINEGQIFANSAGDVTILNNIGVAPSGKYFTSSYNNATSVLSDYNLDYSGTPTAGRAGAPLGPHDRVAAPAFVDAAGLNFHLTAASPAIDTGTKTLAPKTDFDGNPRPYGKAYDRGAYEWQGKTAP